MNTRNGCLIEYTRKDGSKTRHDVEVQQLPSGYIEFHEGQDKIFSLGPLALLKFLRGEAIPYENGGMVRLLRAEAEAA